ncbi:MAG: hypothetical protein L6Q77_12365 [Bacteroidetes bacterium]|nr:hypothetical protein [Bacteroidota bacterium]
MKIKHSFFLLILLNLTSIAGCENPTGPNSKPDLDTTNHTKAWSIEKMGGYGSVLNDVAIVNDTCLWVFGILYDSTSEGNRWNAAKWNGKAWTYFQIMFKMYNPPIGVPEVITAWFDKENTIWLISEVGSYCKMSIDGALLETELNYVDKGLPRKIWGFKPDHWFLAGSRGSVTEFDGKSLKLLDTQTNIHLSSVSGNEDGTRVFFSGFELFGEGRSCLIKKENSTLSLLITRDPTKGEKNLSVSWYNPKSDKIWIFNDNSFGYFKNPNFTDFTSSGKGTFFPEAITGTGDNNIFIAGHLGGISHFNGASLYEYPDFKNIVSIFLSIEVYKNQVFAVGFSDKNGVLVIGR